MDPVFCTGDQQRGTDGGRNSGTEQLRVPVRQWPDIAAEARNAERFARIDPRTSLLYCRRTLEFTLQWIFTADSSLNQPYKDDINGMLNEPTFKRLAGERLLDKMHAVRKITRELCVNSDRVVRAHRG